MHEGAISSPVANAVAFPEFFCWFCAPEAQVKARSPDRKAGKRERDHRHVLAAYGADRVKQEARGCRSVNQELAPVYMVHGTAVVPTSMPKPPAGCV